MNAKIKLISLSDGEKILEEVYNGSVERKGRYLRYEYFDGNYPTNMTVCFDDKGLYRLDSQGQRHLAISCRDGSGTAKLTLGNRSIEGIVLKFSSIIKETEKGYTTSIHYALTFDKVQWIDTRLTIEAEMI